MKKFLQKGMAMLLAVILVLPCIPVLGVSASGTSTPTGTYQGHTYRVYENCDSWEEAKVFCESMGGHLATITSADENAYLFSFIKTCGYESAYFGATDSEQEGVWKWVTGEPFSYSNWGSGEPNSESSLEDYAMFYWKYTSGQWNDGDFGRRTNNGRKTFICEWDVGSATTIYGEHTYAIFDVDTTWTEAKELCESMGGHLATITSEEEQQAVEELLAYDLTYTAFWLGGRKDGSWGWITEEDFIFTNWDSGEPNGSGNYMQIFSLEHGREGTWLKWDDTAVDGDLGGGVKQQGYICEWDSGIGNSGSNYIPVESVTLKQTSLVLKVGEKKQLFAKCEPSNATNKRLTWTTSDSDVATVDANGVVKACGVGSTTIVAKSDNGKTVSCMLTVKPKNAIDYTDFGYRFVNTHSSFSYSSSYSIPYERYMQLGYEKTAAMALVKKWGGSCFGMSASSILFYKDVMVEEKYDMNVERPIQFQSPTSWYIDFRDRKLVQMLELLQISQTQSYFNWGKGFSAEAVVNELNKGNPVLLGMHATSGGGHAVVIHQVEIVGDVYKFQIYDCSGFVSALQYTNEDNWQFTYKNSQYEWTPTLYFTFDEIYSAYSYLTSNNYNGAASLFSLRSIEPTYTYVVTLAQDMTIANSSGQVFEIVDGEVLGENEDIRLIPSSYLAEEPAYTIILPTDDYTITGTGEEVVETTFADDYMIAAVTARADAPIAISADLNRVEVGTEAGENYSVQYTAFDNLFDELTLSGTASGAVTATLTGAEVALTGAETLNVSATVSEAVVSASAANLTDEVNVVCQEADGGATLHILRGEAALTEAVALPQRQTVAAPVFDLPGGTYEEGQSLTFTKDEDTIIYYTTDGSIPSADNGMIYSLPIEVNRSMTISAVSTKYGYADSAVVEQTYTLPEVAAPRADVESGEYDRVITVELSGEDPDDVIYYTMDGSDPVDNGILYTVPLVIDKDTYLQAYKLENGCISEISEYEYTIVPEQAFYISNALTNQNGEVLTAYNLSTLTQVNLTLTKLHEGEQNGLFELAFFDADGELIYAKTKEAVISEEIGIVSIEIDEDVSYAHEIIALGWKDSSYTDVVCGPYTEYIDAYDLTLGDVRNGRVTLDKVRGVAGEAVTVTVMPDNGFELKAIKVDNKTIEGNTFTITGNHVVTATFSLQGGEIVLDADWELGAVINVADDVTIDLNGYTIRAAEGKDIVFFNVGSTGHLTIKDSAGGGKVQFGNTATGNPGILVSGELTLESGTLTGWSRINDGTYGAGGTIYMYADSLFEMTGGTITGADCAAYSAIRSNGGGQTITITGGEITKNNASSDCVVYVAGTADNPSTLTIGGDAVVAGNTYRENACTAANYEIRCMDTTVNIGGNARVGYLYNNGTNTVDSGSYYSSINISGSPTVAGVRRSAAVRTPINITNLTEGANIKTTAGASADKVDNTVSKRSYDNSASSGVTQDKGVIYTYAEKVERNPNQGSFSLQVIKTVKLNGQDVDICRWVWTPFEEE